MSQYKLVWSDEFDYEGKPNPEKWDYELGGHGFGNGESQYYTDQLDNAYVKDGKLTIVAKKEDYEGKGYTSARLSTYQIQSWQYGKISVRAQLPKGKGTWPAVWMLPNAINEGTSWPLCGEIDIMEHIGRDQNMVHFSLHTDQFNHRKKSQLTEFKRFEQVSDRFYEYTMEWTPEYIEYFVDGTSVAKFDNSSYTTVEEWPFDQPFYLILNLAIGGFWGGEIDDTIFPQKMVIDYVKVYQKA